MAYLEFEVAENLGTVFMRPRAMCLVVFVQYCFVCSSVRDYSGVWRDASRFIIF